MSQWPMVKLGELISKASVKKAGESNLPILSMTMHEGLVLQSDRFDKRIASKSTANYQVVGKNQLVVGFPIDEGVLDIQTLANEAIVSPAYKIWTINDTKKVFPDFLRLYLRSNRALAFYSIKLRGTTARRRALPDDIFLSMPVILPPLEEQRRIARILNTPSHVKALIAKRIQLLDVLISSIIKNYYSSAYPTVKVGEIARVATGATPSRKNKEFFNGNIPWVKTGEVLNNRLSETEEHISAQALKETSCNLLPTGSTLVAMYGQGKTRGRVAILEKPMTTNQACAAVTPFDESDSEYLFQILRFNYHELRSAGRGGTQPNLNLGIVKNFQIPYPQNSVERAQLIRQCLEIDSQKSKLESQLQKFEELHQSLATRAFAGQL